MNDSSRKWSVYIHTCKVNQKTYVGITCKKPELRWGYQGNGYKGQAFFKAIQKYGWDNFDHKIVETDLSEAEAKELEIFLIDKLQSHVSKHGYNVSLGGDGYLGVDNHGEKNPMYGRRHSDETKAKISATNKGRALKPAGWRHTEEARRKMSLAPRPTVSGKNNYWYGRRNDKLIEVSIAAHSKAVCQFDLDMELIQTYPSAMQAERETGVNHSRIAACCRHKSKTANGYIWIYKSELSNLAQLKTYLINNLIDTNKVLFGKAVYQFDTSLNFIQKFLSLHDAERATGVSRSSIAKACGGTAKTAGTCIWKYEKDVPDIEKFKEEYTVDLRRDGKHVLQLDSSCNIIGSFVSCADAARDTGILRSCIAKACRGEQHTAGGFIWVFEGNYMNRTASKEVPV